MDFRPILENDYIVLRAADREHLLRFDRTELPLRFEASADTVFQAVSDELRRFEPKRWSLLVDLRRAPARNDSAFENEVAKWQMALFRRFERTAVLVRTAAGRLQIGRMSGRAAVSLPVYLDEAEALAHLTSPPQVRSRPPG